MAALAQLSGQELPPLVNRKRPAEDDPQEGSSVVKKLKVDQGIFYLFIYFFIEKINGNRVYKHSLYIFLLVFCPFKFLFIKLIFYP